VENSSDSALPRAALQGALVSVSQAGLAYSTLQPGCATSTISTHLLAAAMLRLQRCRV
jgi:hypothetical protein